MKLANLNESIVDRQTIETLEELLAQAKSGEIVSICFVDGRRDGKAAHGWAGRPTSTMIGEIENLKFDYFSQMYFPAQEGDQ
jgi:hypothetical protein